MKKGTIPEKELQKSALGKLLSLWLNTKICTYRYNSARSRREWLLCVWTQQCDYKDFTVLRCESWTVKKAECRKIDAFELWCWRRLLRVPWRARRSNQSILKEISPEYSLEGFSLITICILKDYEEATVFYIFEHWLLNMKRCIEWGVSSTPLKSKALLIYRAEF